MGAQREEVVRERRRTRWRVEVDLMVRLIVGVANNVKRVVGQFQCEGISRSVEWVLRRGICLPALLFV
jgi:hypothetical protein